MISEERLEKAMIYLAHTDEEAAKAKALCKKLEKMERIITEHLVGGKVVEEYVNPRPFRKIETEGG